MLDPTAVKAYHEASVDGTEQDHTAYIINMLARQTEDQRGYLLNDMKALIADLQSRVDVLESRPEVTGKHFHAIHRRAIEIDTRVERLDLLYELSLPAAEILKLHQK